MYPIAPLSVAVTSTSRSSTSAVSGVPLNVLVCPLKNNHSGKGSPPGTDTSHDEAPSPAIAPPDETASEF